MGTLLRLAASAAAFWLATLLISGVTITAETTWGKIGTFFAVAVIFGIVNAVLRPFIKVFKFVGFIFYILTLGLIALVINGLLFLLTSWIAELLRTNDILDIDFRVENLWSAILGAIVVGVASWLINHFIED